MYSSALLLVYPGILTLSERLILKHYYEWFQCTNIFGTTVVGSAYGVDGQWAFAEKWALATNDEDNQVSSEVFSYQCSVKVWETLPNTLITSEHQRWWSSQHTSKHSRTSLAYILMDWTLHCFALNWPLLTCSALWKRTPRILVHRESSGRSKALHPGWNFAAHILVVTVEQEAMLNRPKLWS